MIFRNPGGPDGAYRGGSWFNVALLARAAYRSAVDPSALYGILGLRLMRRCS